MARYAIIGLAGVYPDADTPERLFENLLQGKNSIRRFDREELRRSGVPEDVLDSPRFRPFGTVLADFDRFDADFFAMSPHEARITDPQQRIFLSCAYQALQDAGYDPLAVDGRVGVFGSTSENTYFREVVMRSEFYSPFGIDYSVPTGNALDFLSTRVSYKLNLTGPSLTVLSACSSSLVALTAAIRSLDAGECDAALVGGVSLWLPQPSGYMSAPGAPFSQSGRVSPFDDQADGFIRGSGCSIVVVKRLADAEADRDHIYGVIEGFGINNDGRRKVGFLAPSVEGQVGAIKAALAQARIASSDLAYVEAHGTGTRLGDPIELRALGRGYGRTADAEKLWVGSIKANIGHLDAAAGVTGLVKVLMMMKHGVIPQQINYRSPNPNFNFEANGVGVSGENRPLGSGTKYMGLTSLGMGGTNVHVIVSSREPVQRVAQPGTFVFPLSGSTRPYLLQQCASLAESLNGSDTPLSDVSYTLFQRLARGEHRAYFVASDVEDLRGQLSAYAREFPERRSSVDAGQRWLASGRKEDLAAAIPDGYRIPLPPIRFLGERHWIEITPPPAAEKKPVAQEKPAVEGRSLLDSVLAIWSRHIGRDVSADETFDDLGGESLTAVLIAGQISSDLSYEVDPNTFDGDLTPRILVRRLSGEGTGSAEAAGNPVKLRAGTKPVDVYLIHPAGGSIFPYRRLMTGIQTDANVYAIGFPRSVDVDTSIGKLAGIYARMIADTCGDHRVVLGGYSFGGNEAIAVAAELRKFDVAVHDILMIDSIVPDAYLDSNLTDEEYLAKLPEILGFATGNGKWTGATTTARYGSVEQAIQSAREAGVVPEGLETAAARRIYQTWVANHRVLCRQQLADDLDVHVTILYANEHLSDDLYSFTRMRPFEPAQWTKYCTRLSTIEVPGNHYSIFSDERLLAQLRRQFQITLRSIEEPTKESILMGETTRV
ncbi:MAG TPA: beta-ketoacyl synthase N-terminal-like domain-containing protein [Pseudonocardiaceae bacterium]